MNEPEPAKNEPVDHGKVVRQHGMRISWAWLFPLLAAAATAWLFWSNWKSNGPEVEISFDNAPGIQAGKTPLIYRGVTAGMVTKVKLDGGLDKVVLVVRLKEFASELARQGTVFWIDQPVVGLGSTSGLDALIQGNSLQARMGGGPPASHFTGAARVPLTPLESPALVLKLRAQDIPFLDRGSPLFYRGVAVGMVEDKALDEKGPYLHVVVEKEFAQTVRSNARFWPVPATSIKVGSGGVKLDMLGLKAILLGGVEFDVFDKPGGAVSDDTEFALCADQVAARATGAPVRIAFKNGQGIQAGQTEVRHLGMPIGYVETAKLDPANQSVDTVVRFQPAFENLHSPGTVFTLVRPRISLQGVSGLETLVTGPYIDCAPGGPGGGIADSFEGRTLSDEEMAAAQSETAGIHVTLHAKILPPLGEGAPVLYRGLVAGRVKTKSIDASGEPFLDVVIRKEFASTVPRNTRFWQVPATSVQAGPGVLNIDVASLESLIRGGVAFDVFDKPEAAARSSSSSPRSPPPARHRRRFASHSKMARACWRGRRRFAISASPSDSSSP